MRAITLSGLPRLPGKAPDMPTIRIDEKTLNAGEEIIFEGVQMFQALAHAAARDAGWYADEDTGKPIDRSLCQLIALGHFEGCEAMEAAFQTMPGDTPTQRDGVEIAIADDMVRIMAMAGYLGLDVAGAVIEKMRLNAARADHMPATRADEGAKKY